MITEKVKQDFDLKGGIIMNSPIFHFRNDGRLIGTFVSKKVGDKVLFGWSRFNKIKEKNSGNPFIKKIGIEFAEQSTVWGVRIDTTNDTISKGTVTVRDPKMVKAAVEFINRLQRYYHKPPSNVNIIYKIEDLKGMINDLIEENRTLIDRLRRLSSVNSKLMENHENMRKENTDLVNKLSELHVLLGTYSKLKLRDTVSVLTAIYDIVGMELVNKEDGE